MSHACVVIYRHPRETWSQQEVFLHERIVPMVKSQPGFLAGYWSYEKNESKTVGYIVFANEADAKKLQAFLHEEAKRPNPFGVEQVSVDVVQVLAEARAA